MYLPFTSNIQFCFQWYESNTHLCTLMAPYTQTHLFVFLILIFHVHKRNICILICDTHINTFLLPPILTDIKNDTYSNSLCIQSTYLQILTNIYYHFIFNCTLIHLIIIILLMPCFSTDVFWY